MKKEALPTEDATTRHVLHVSKHHRSPGLSPAMLILLSGYPAAYFNPIIVQAGRGGSVVMGTQVYPQRQKDAPPLLTFPSKQIIRSLPNHVSPAL